MSNDINLLLSSELDGEFEIPFYIVGSKSAWVSCWGRLWVTVWKRILTNWILRSINGCLFIQFIKAIVRIDFIIILILFEMKILAVSLSCLFFLPFSSQLECSQWQNTN